MTSSTVAPPAVTGRPTPAMKMINFAVFQAAWFAVVIGAAHHRPLLGTVAAVAAVLWHLAVSARPAPEAKLVAIVSAIGFVIETIAVAAGYIGYEAGQPISWLPPYWMIAMWALLAIALNVTLRWLRGRPLLAAILGAVLGPVSYASGVRLGAAHFIDATAAAGMMACAWFVVVPLLSWLSVRFDGVAAE